MNDRLRDTIVVSKLKNQVSRVPGVSILKPITYNTLFLPDTGRYRYLYGCHRNTLPLYTEAKLLNSIKPIANSANDGSRWATLRDWTSNDAVKNHNGYGGTDIDK